MSDALRSTRTGGAPLPGTHRASAVRMAGWILAGLVILGAAGDLVVADTHNPFGSHHLDLEQRDATAACPYCHTPHRSAQASPTWHRHEPVTTFRSYDTLSTTGRVEIEESVSIACLTCHDGTQAHDVAPNIGPLSPAGTEPPVTSRPDHEHPIGVVYGGFRKRLTGYAMDRLASDMIGGRRRWWVDVEPVVNGIRDKWDLILYVRELAGEDVPFVECPTCHDPHANAARTFLRTSSTDSGVCYACHTL